MALYPDNLMHQYGLPTSGEALQHVTECRARLQQAWYTDPGRLVELLTDDDTMSRLAAKHEIDAAAAALKTDRETRRESFGLFISGLSKQTKH